jgi:hypothetical protein
MSDWDASLLTLLDLQRRFERGPKREGVFALWLATRLALMIAESQPGDAKLHRRQLALLRHRLSQLAIPRPLSRGLTTALAHLDDVSPTAARIALTQLVAPARDALGPDAAEAVAVAARTIHDRMRDEG